MMVPRFRLRLLNEFPPRSRYVAGASTFWAGLATERQAAGNIAFALTERASESVTFRIIKLGNLALQMTRCLPFPKRRKCGGLQPDVARGKAP
jgi:hypothetical protein